MATLAGQRAQFTWALNQYNATDDPVVSAKYAERMAKYIDAAPRNGFTVEQVTQGQSYPADEVARYLGQPAIGAGDPDISEEQAVQRLANAVDTSQVIREGEGTGVVYAYSYACTPDRLKVGMTDGDTVQRIAAQIGTSTPDRPVLLLEIRTNTCRALERAIHGVLETRAQKIVGGGAEWFKTSRDEVLAIYKFIQRAQ
jgi:hypothetical protein